MNRVVSGDARQDTCVREILDLGGEKEVSTL